VSVALVELAPLLYCSFHSRPARLSLPSAGLYYRHCWVPHVKKIKHRTSAPILTVVCLPSMAGRSHEAPGTPSHSDLEQHRHSKVDLSQRLGDLAARETLIGHVCHCQDLGLSWKSASSRACCVEGSHRGLDRHLSDGTLWADCDLSGREPGNVRRSFAGRTLKRKPDDSVSFRFVRGRSGFV